MRHQILPGNTDSAEIRGLEGGVSYSVRVTALVGDREGTPVSIVVTTRRQSMSWRASGWVVWMVWGSGLVLQIGERTRIGSEPLGAGSERREGEAPDRQRGWLGGVRVPGWAWDWHRGHWGRASLIPELSLQRLRLRQPWGRFKWCSAGSTR